MLVVISPAKTLDFETAPATKKSSQPRLLKQASELAQLMKDYTPENIADLMGVSQKIAELNFQRFQDWHTPFTTKNAKQAVLAFKGDVYTGLEAETFSEKDFEFAQKHLCILSGLYGLLKPLDLIQPYRLEMGLKLENGQGKNLYEFWGSQIDKVLNKQLSGLKSETLINLASNEYFNVLDKKALGDNVITPVFKDYKNGKYKIVSFYAKKARGLMSAYIIKNKITSPEKIKRFKGEGYYYSAEDSTKTQWVFLRDAV